jgi:hypothetical protein
MGVGRKKVFVVIVATDIATDITDVATAKAEVATVTVLSRNNFLTRLPDKKISHCSYSTSQKSSVSNFK